MLKRIKEWIIKKLGGYTESEFWNNRLIEYVPVKEEKVYTTLYAEQRFDKVGLSSFSGDDIKRYLVAKKWVDQLLPYVELKIEYLSYKERIVKAILRVVDVNLTHEEHSYDN